MRKGAIFVLAAFMLSAAAPAFAQQQNHQQEVACALAAQNCLNVANILQKRIQELNSQIQKGNTKYSEKDLQQLEKLLKENQALLDRIEGKTPEK